MKNEELIIVDDIMSAVTETEIWNEIQRTDPWITAANKSLNKFLKDNAPAIEDAVEGLVYNMVNAYVQSAILYGMPLKRSCSPSGLTISSVELTSLRRSWMT
ncbi:MAG: hypothetical protein SOR61_04790 [Evtepia sp.]|uniref:hypothetical protein n=1 Tax=Evtepia sp. TaxID=2773933 RepID=UPI002A74B65E|nr:hypothetical protein [Evtepia sp.]MDY3014499.1 hypothetical protein [Evtepia sp.]